MKSITADRQAFRRAAQELYGLCADPATGDIFCALCGCWLPHETVPHHIHGAGLGGRRRHEVDNLEYLCAQCHNAKHF